MNSTATAIVALGAFGILTGGAAGELLLDQIGGEPFTPTALSSSQFPPGMPERAFTTVDNFSLPDSDNGSSFHITQIEAVVAGINNFVSWDLVDSWTIQIYSSLEVSTQTLFGDVYSATFDFPDALTDGFATFGGRPVELATFDVDFLLAPGDYWMTVAMGNLGATNGTVGIAGSSIGDGPAYFSGPGPGASTPLSRPAAYRIIGAVPAPPAAIVLVAGLAVGKRRRGRVRNSE